MADVLVDGEEQVRRVDDQVVLARLHRRRLQLGACIARGTPAAIQRDPKVLDAYLGDSLEEPVGV